MKLASISTVSVLSIEYGTIIENGVSLIRSRRKMENKSVYGFVKFSSARSLHEILSGNKVVELKKNGQTYKLRVGPSKKMTTEGGNEDEKKKSNKK